MIKSFKQGGDLRLVQTCGLRVIISPGQPSLNVWVFGDVTSQKRDCTRKYRLGGGYRYIGEIILVWKGFLKGTRNL